MARWFVYVVRCRDGSLYTGVSTDVAARVATHNAGAGARYTRSRRPVELVHVERTAGRGPALRREAAIKALPRADKLRLLADLRTGGLRPGRPARSPAAASPRPPAPRSRS